MNPEQERFSFKGTITAPICKDCIYINGADCIAFQLKRSNAFVLNYIQEKSCPRYEKRSEQIKFK